VSVLKTTGSTTVTTTATIGATTDVVFFTASAPYTISLPTPVNGRRLSLVRTDASAFIVSITGHINGASGATSTTLFPSGGANRRAVLISNGTSWYVEWAGTSAT
jgi:hypothetical protein